LILLSLKNSAVLLTVSVKGFLEKFSEKATENTEVLRFAERKICGFFNGLFESIKKGQAYKRLTLICISKLPFQPVLVPPTPFKTVPL